MLVGLPCASLCINYRLYRIAKDNVVHASKADKRRAVVVDLLIGLGIPVLQGLLRTLRSFIFLSLEKDLFLYYADIVCQGTEFLIYERIGPFPSTFPAWISFLLVFSWPVVIGIISAVYASMTIYAFYKHQANFNALLAANAPNLTRHHYWRLMLLAGTDLVMVLAFNIL